MMEERETPQTILEELCARALLSEEETEEYRDRMGAALTRMGVELVSLYEDQGAR